MHSVSEHYESHLAPIYVWMAGGFESAVTRGRAEVDTACPAPSHTRVAVDLGAGFGMHAIPLADAGYSVLALDSSSALLEAINTHAGARSIVAINDDLLSFNKYINAPVELFVCMGDTLTHLPDRHSVERLFAGIAEAIMPGGTFVVTFRDYSNPLMGAARFIPVRSDSDRILTCFLEYEDEAVIVHDILHERDGAQWRQRVSAYRKLRLAPEWVIGKLEGHGLRVRREQGSAGMVRLIAKKSL